METQQHTETQREFECVDYTTAGKIQAVASSQTQDSLLTFPDIRSGHSGLAKSHYQEAGRLIMSSTSTSGIYGDDRTFEMECHNQIEGWRLLVMALADGHGVHGARVSEHAILGLESALAGDSISTYAHHLMEREHHEAEQFMIRLFHTLDDTCPLEQGGSTLTVAFIFTHAGRIVITTHNVGDSPCLLLNNRTGHVACLATSHTWDCPSERQHNIEVCRAAGRPVNVPIYSRWNTSHGSRIMDHENLFRPIPIFVEDTAVVDTNNRRHVMRALQRHKKPGGIQSLRRMKILVRSEDSWIEESLESEAHGNTGATPLEIDLSTGKIYGGPQMTRSIGDRRYKNPTQAGIPLLHSTPTMTLYELAGEDDLTLLLCSDGCSDVFYLHQIGDLAAHFFHTFGPTASMPDFCHHLLKHALKQGLAGGLTISTGCRVWDDISILARRILVHREARK